jgi:hypothetical protein
MSHIHALAKCDFTLQLKKRQRPNPAKDEISLSGESYKKVNLNKDFK